MVWIAIEKVKSLGQKENSFKAEEISKIKLGIAGLQTRNSKGVKSREFQLKSASGQAPWTNATSEEVAFLTEEEITSCFHLTADKHIMFKNTVDFVVNDLMFSY